MCFTPELSASFAIGGSIIAAYLLTKGTYPVFLPFVILFYVLMETLQTIQYYIVNECDNPWNIGLTEIAYGLVIAQPLLWNTFFYLNAKSSESLLFLSGIVLSSVWMIVNIAARIAYTPANAQTATNSVYASDRVCTLRKTSHLYWKWTLANFGELNATFLTYLMLWFIPALISSSYRSVSLLLIASALLSALYTVYVGEPEIFTAAWCYVSVPIVYIIFMKEIWKSAR